MAYDPKDDVDRLFACFKCGVSTPDIYVPESAVRERRLSVARLKATSGRGEAPEVSKPSSSKRSCKDSGEKEKKEVRCRSFWVGFCNAAELSDRASLQSGRAGLQSGRSERQAKSAEQKSRPALQCGRPEWQGRSAERQTRAAEQICRVVCRKEDQHGAYMSAAIKLKSGKQISPIIFYGSPHGAPLKRPSRLLRLLHEIHVDLNEENDFISRKGVWATFPRQEEAIRFLKGHTQAKLFSYQDHLSGQRRFLASTYNEFWTRYIGMDSKLRHHYEVIQEGTPCHLYFDLEFDKKVNADKDVDEMVDILVSFTYDLLFDKYSIEGNNGWIIELDSSTSVKFSRHVIIRIPRVAFKDNSHVGAFVMEVYSRITSQRGSVPQVDKLYVKKDASSSDRQPFLDNAVYSRNRCFRLAFSSKAGKNSFLLPTERFKCKNMVSMSSSIMLLLHFTYLGKWKLQAMLFSCNFLSIQISHFSCIILLQSKQDVFMESLICRMDCDCSKLLVCQIDADCRKTLCFDFETYSQEILIDQVQQQAQGVSQYAAFDVYRSDFPNTFTSGKSPFPALDAFVEYIASSGNALGKIRSWYWFSSHGLIVYSMLRSRYCERIGREHKSNHVDSNLFYQWSSQELESLRYIAPLLVMYVADLHRAVYYQKCYDPDCRGYRSPLRPLPHDVIPDNVPFLNSTEVTMTNINGDLGGSHLELYSNDNDKLVTESCMEENSWLQEAMKFADCVENSRNAPDFGILNEEAVEDCSWWMDVELLVSQVEEGLG
ncbi:hypothetical protein ZIOFF_032421 [Zingiber officinale]|uniref:DNA-directed primase/polymerase protein n=1 Tax=Zingiber officinale TaxID=94328 RepID=A0A8J5LBK4_ZINOF|nr:hypothetical protein ZIOFF_032421 [Zingiber officinale]